jgi:CRISPR-associated protein Cas5d
MTIRLWQATMRNRGIITFLPPWECIHRPVREMNMKTFGTEKQNFSLITEQEVFD